MKNKVMAAVIAALMVVCVVPVAAADADATSTTTYGEFAVYTYTTDGGWTYSTATGYNAYLAVADYCSDNNLTLAADSSYTVLVESDWGDYYTINTTYGNITSIGSDANGTTQSWHTYVFVNDSWSETTVGLGFYKPFSDYDSNLQTANIALFYGTDANASTAMTSLPTENLKSVYSDIQGNSDFLVTFHLSVNSSTIYGTSDGHIDTVNGTTITGYGSDVATALKNAMGTCTNYEIDLAALYSTGLNQNYYGYTTMIHGIEGANLDTNNDGYIDTYYYWSSYIGQGTSNYASYMFGFYSPLSEANGLGSEFVQDEFTLIYVVS